MTKDQPPLEDPHAALEQLLIDEFLARSGYTRGSLDQLSLAEKILVLAAASAYASLRLAEIESKAHYIDEFHRPL